MKPHRNIALLSAYNVMMGFLPIFPVLIPFYKNQIGLSFQDFLIGEVVFAAVVVAMEIPSGWLSDIWKRKHCLCVAAVVEGLGLSLLGVADGLLMAVTAQGLIGIGVGLVSGTTSAMLYDTLQDQGKEEQFRKHEGKRAAAGLYSIGLTSLAGGFLYEVDPYLPVWLSAITYFLALPMALMMEEPARHREAVQKNPFYDMFQVLRYALRQNKEIAALVFFTGILYGSTQAGSWIAQPYYIALEIPEAWFGIFASIGFLIAAVGSQMGHFLERYFRPVKILAVLWVAVILCWTFSGLFLWYHALVLLMISNAAWGIGFPVMQDALNKRVGSERRATVLSVASLMIRFVFMPLGLVLGWIVDDYGVQAGLLFLVAFVLLANIWNVKKLLMSR